MKAFRIPLTLLILGILSASKLPDTDVIIQFLNVRGEKGNMLISLYDAPEQFPYKPKWRYMISKTKLKEQGNKYPIREVKSGKYAIAIFDDENCDTVMQKNFLGMPKEGYGFSNNIKPSIRGAPSFEECTFPVNDGKENIVKIELQYLFRKSCNEKE